MELADGTEMQDITGSITWSGGANGIEMNSLFLEPVPITRDNLDVVLDAGWIEKDELCNGAESTASACQ